MVWLTWPSPSLLSEWVQACGRLPSTELALVRDAVRERVSRVMLAEGTMDRGGAGHEGQWAEPGTTGGRRTHASKAASETHSSDGRGLSQARALASALPARGMQPATVSEPGLGRGPQTPAGPSRHSWPETRPGWQELTSSPGAEGRRGHCFSVACLERMGGLGEGGDSAKEAKLP